MPSRPPPCPRPFLSKPAVPRMQRPRPVRPQVPVPLLLALAIHWQRIQTSSMLPASIHFRRLGVSAQSHCRSQRRALNVWTIDQHGKATIISPSSLINTLCIRQRPRTRRRPTHLFLIRIPFRFLRHRTPARTTSCCRRTLTVSPQSCTSATTATHTTSRSRTTHTARPAPLRPRRWPRVPTWHNCAARSRATARVRARASVRVSVRVSVKVRARARVRVRVRANLLATVPPLVGLDAVTIVVLLLVGARCRDRARIQLRRNDRVVFALWNHWPFGRALCLSTEPLIA